MVKFGRGMVSSSRFRAGRRIRAKADGVEVELGGFIVGSQGGHTRFTICLF
jgi:hypothetical protein